jgi:WD40 repeat protein
MSNRGEWVLKENTFREINDGTLCGMSDIHQQSGGVVQVVAFSTGSKSRPSAFFAVAMGDGSVTIRSTLGWKVLAQFEFLFPTTCLAFSNGSRMLAMGGKDGKVRIVATSPVWKVTTEVDVNDSVASMAFSKNNERLVVGTTDGTLIVFDPTSHFSVVGMYEENDSAVRSIDWCTQHLAVGYQDGSLLIFESGNIFKGRFGPLVCINDDLPLCQISFGLGGNYLAVAAEEGKVSVYSAAGNWVLMHDVETGFAVPSLKWSPDGRLLALAGQSELKILDTVFWAEVEGLPQPDIDSEEGHHATATLIPKGEASPSLSFSQDGRLLAAACRKSGVRVLNTSTFDVVLNLQTWDKTDDSSNSDLSTPPGT